MPVEDTKPPARRFDEDAIALNRSVAEQDPRLGRHDRPAPTVRNPHPTTAPPGHGVPRQDRHDLIQLS
jgi:hypothetical protein